MKMIDYISKNDYIKSPGTRENISSHPKFSIILKDGTILYADLSNDNAIISIFGKNTKCTEHIHFISKLIENYFDDNDYLKNKCLSANVFAPIIYFLNEGYIVFNNITTYQGPLYFLHGLSAQLLIPEKITESQQESLEALNEYINYFNEIEVKEYQDVEKNIKQTYFDSGATAVANYFKRNGIVKL